MSQESSTKKNFLPEIKTNKKSEKNIFVSQELNNPFKVFIKTRLFVSISLLLTACLGIYLFNLTRATKIIYLPLEADCQLHIQSCTANISNSGKLTIDFKQQIIVGKDFSKGFSPTESLKMMASLAGIKAENVVILIGEKDTYTSYLEHKINRHDINAEFSLLQYVLYPQKESMTYYREGGLSACINTLVEWIALVRVKVGNITYEIPFEFETSMSVDEHSV